MDYGGIEEYTHRIGKIVKLPLAYEADSTKQRLMVCRTNVGQSRTIWDIHVD